MLSLLRRLKPEVFPPGTVLLQQGVINTRLYFVSEGVVTVWRNFDTESREHLATLGKNSFFGEQSLMQGVGGTANATIQTLSFCDLLILGRDDFDDVLREHLGSAELLRESDAACVKHKEEGESGPAPERTSKRALVRQASTLATRISTRGGKGGRRTSNVGLEQFYDQHGVGESLNAQARRNSKLSTAPPPAAAHDGLQQV